jgi:hypothetical protein
MTPPTPPTNPPYTIATYGDHALITIQTATDGVEWMDFWRSHGQAIAEILRDRTAKLDIFMAIERKRLSNLGLAIMLDVIEIAQITPPK